MGEMGKAPLNLYLDTNWNGQLYTPVDLPPEEEPTLCLGKRTRDKFLFNKTNRSTNFSKFILVKKFLHVSGSSSAHHQEFSTRHSALVYVMLV